MKFLLKIVTLIFLSILFVSSTSLADVRVINTSTNRILMKLADGKKIPQSNAVTFRAMISKTEKAEIKSVIFSLSGAEKLSNSEKVAPFCFLGNDKKRCNRGKKLKSGGYTLKVTKIFKTKKSKTEIFKFTVISKGNESVRPVPTGSAPAINPTSVPENTYNFPIDSCGQAPCQFPTAENTGVKNRSILEAYKGKLETTKPGQIIENLNVRNGDIVIKHDNVVVRNVLLEHGTILVEDGANNWLVEHVEIYGPDESNLMVTSRGGSGIARFIYAHNAESDFLRGGSNQIFECNYVTNLGMGAESHADVVQFYTASDITYENTYFRFNNFEIKPQNCSGSQNPNCKENPSGFRSNTLLITSGNASTKNVHFECNWNLNGGGYTMYVNGGKTISSQNDYAFIINNNLFGCNYKFGLTTGLNRNNNLWSGNINVCSGQEIKN